MDVSQYLEIFIDETSEHIQSLSDCIMVLEKEPDNKDTVNEIFRAAHSLKGMAGTMGFKRMQHLTHTMENVFQEVRSDNVKVNSAMIDILFKCLDAIEGYLDNVKATSNEGEDDNEALVTGLNNFLEAQEAGGEEAGAESAGAAQEAEPAGNKKYLEAGKAEAAREAIKKAMDNGMKVYGITATINKDCLLKAARAFLVFKAVEEMGDIIFYDPSSQDIEDEKFEFDFSFFLETESAELNQILEAAKGVTEIDEVVGELITEEILQEEAKQAEAEEEAEAAAEAAAQEEPKSIAAPAPVANTAPASTAASSGSSGDKSSTQPAKGKAVTARTIRVDIEKLDSLMNQVSELIIAKNGLVAAHNSSSMTQQEATEQIEYLERITTSLHESVMKVRMVPIESTVNKFPRMIRDLSRKLNKKMDLIMTGEETELDRTVVDQIGDPLQHLLRNSADHGIENAELRAQRGKPETGTIKLTAFQEGNNVIIEVEDDGGGIDTEAVKAKAIERGVITASQAENMSQKEIINLLFLPSFSMAKEITDISGRGVGLDVVKSNIEALGGDVEVKSSLGEGSKFIVRLPLTLAIIQSLMVEIRNEKYAIPLASIQTIENTPLTDIKFVESKEVINLRGTVIPIVRLDKILEVEPEQEDGESLTVVIVRKGDTMTGLVVDNLIGQQEIVIKSLGKYIKNSKLISGATILGDGEVALILDVNTLM